MGEPREDGDYRLIGELGAEGVAVALISADMLELIGLSDRIHVLFEGAIAGTLERREFSEEAIMRLGAGGEGRDGPRGSIRGHLRLGLPALLLAAAIASVAAVWSRDFFAPGNIGNLVDRVLPLALVALGETAVLLTGRIDLSVGAIISLSTAILATTSAELGWLSVPLTLLGGLACGGLNAAGVRLLRVDALITTLAVSAIVEGAALLLLPTPGGEVDYGYYGVFYGQGQVFGWPLAVTIVAFALAFVLFGFTRFGRRLYALGSDGRAAYANGVDVARVEVAVFLVSGFLASAAGAAIGIKILSGDPHIGDFSPSTLSRRRCSAASRCRADAAASSACSPAQPRLCSSATLSTCWSSTPTCNKSPRA